MTEKYDYLFKFIIIGDAGCGKSALLHRFIDDTFKSQASHTIGVEFGSKIIEVGGQSVKLQIWDTAGQERFRAVTQSYYRGAAGALLVYDVTSRDSFNNVSTWLNNARALANPDISIVLVGNKLDLTQEREVNYMEASQFCQDNDLMFLETSALTNEGVEDVFLKCARKILTGIENGQLDPESMNSGVQLGPRRLNKQSESSPEVEGGCNC